MALPPKAAMPEHGAGVVEAKRNGGLDLLKTAAEMKKSLKHGKSPCPCQRFFSFPVRGWFAYYNQLNMFFLSLRYKQIEQEPENTMESVNNDVLNHC